MCITKLLYVYNSTKSKCFTGLRSLDFYALLLRPLFGSTMHADWYCRFIVLTSCHCTIVTLPHTLLYMNSDEIKSHGALYKHLMGYITSIMVSCLISCTHLYRLSSLASA